MKKPNVDIIECVPKFGDEELRPDLFKPAANRTDWYSFGFQWMEGETLVRAAVRIPHTATPAEVAKALFELAACLVDPKHPGAVRDHEQLLGHELNLPKP